MSKNLEQERIGRAISDLKSLRPQFVKCLKIQQATNDKALRGWTVNVPDYHLAVMVEAAEAIDHLDYKWWKGKPFENPNIDQAKMELVDIAHFLLSINLTAPFQGNYPEVDEFDWKGVFDYIHEGFQDCCDTDVSMQSQCEWAAERLQSLMEEVRFGDHEANWKYWAGAAALLGLTWTEFYAKFIGKAALNRFRWENGYGSTYQKIWNGREDNEYLTELVEATLTNNVEPSVELFTSQLSDLYQQIHVQ